MPEAPPEFPESPATGPADEVDRRRPGHRASRWRRRSPWWRRFSSRRRSRSRSRSSPRRRSSRRPSSRRRSRRSRPPARRDGRGVRLDRVAGGVRLVTRPEYDYPVRRLLGLDGKTKLSMAALETLAIVAYRQPVTAPEIAELRSVNSSSSIRTLLDRKLITTAGRKEVVGTPFLYKTTKEFLVHFGLKGLADLPEARGARGDLRPRGPEDRPGADRALPRRRGDRRGGGRRGADRRTRPTPRRAGARLRRTARSRRGGGTEGGTP